MPIINGFDIFGFFLVTALFFIFACFVYVLNKQNQVPLWKASTLYFITVLFLLTGGTLLTIAPDKWISFFETGIFPDTGGITVIGVLIFGPLGILLGKRMLRIKVQMLDSLAIPLLLAMAIQRMGCLFAGCCNGIMTNSDFGVSYAPFTTAHRFCAQNGSLETFHSCTPSLHPVPFYLFLVCLLSAFVIYKSKHLLKANGSRFMAAIMLFLLGRFVVDFWREPLTEGIFGNMVYGLKGIQWLLIAGGTSLLTVIYFREKNKRQGKLSVYSKIMANSSLSIFKSLMILSFFIGIFILIRNLFSPAERTALILFSSISLCLYIVEYCRLHLPHYKFIANGIAFILVVLFLPIMAQISYDNSSNTVFTYNEITIGNQTSLFHHFHEKADAYSVIVGNTFDGFGDCNLNTGGKSYKSPIYSTRYTYHEKYKHEIYGTAIGFAKYYNYGNNSRFYFKANVAAAIDKSSDPLERDGYKNEWLLAINPMLGFDTKRFGMNVQTTFGRLHLYDGATGEKNGVLTAGKPDLTLKVPSFNIRIASIRYIYADLRSGASSFGLNTNVYPIMVGLGSGLGHDNGNFARLNFGVAYPYLVFGIGCKIHFLDNALELDGLAYQKNGGYIGITYSYVFGRR